MNGKNDPLAISLFSEIAMAEQLIHARLSKALPKGMEVSHFSVLNHLSHVGSERTPAQLARLFRVTKGAMTNTLSKLEASGYIHTRPDWDDARRKFIQISPSGIAARDAAIVAIAPVFDDVITSLGAEKVKAALPFLRDLRRNLETGD